MIQSWIRLFFVTIATGNVQTGLGADVLDTIAGGTIVVKKWENTHLKYLTISRDNDVLLTASLIRNNQSDFIHQRSVIQLQYNKSKREMFLILNKLSKEDEGLYKVEEIMADTSSSLVEEATVEWYFRLNVIDSNELKECKVGENFTTKFRFVNYPRLIQVYHYDKFVADVMKSEFCVPYQMSLYGRLRCIINNRILTIIIKSVSQRDIGLYRVVNYDNERKRVYLNITDGLPTANEAIDSLLGHMQYASLTKGPSVKQFSDTLYTDKHTSSLIERPTSENLIDILNTADSRATRGSYILHSDETLYTEDYKSSPTVRLTFPDNLTTTTSIRIDIRYVIVGGIGLIILVAGCSLWIQRKYIHGINEERIQSLRKCEADLYISPIGENCHLVMPLMTDGPATDFNPEDFDPRLIIHTTHDLCMDGYETVDISSSCTLNEIINGDEFDYDPTETINNSVSENVGYLTVFGVIETTV